VYLGEHIYLNTQAAIKVLDMRLTNDDMSDFLQEARTIARLKHPSIIQVLEFGVENNIPFLAMEYAPNGSLRGRFPKGSRLSADDIQPYVMQIASALQHAHDEKLIHRDVKPENMLLGSNDEVLLADFGIAVVAHSSRTQSMQGVAGTVAYMAPEQLRGMPVKASDQYALAAVIYEWLSGKSLFQGSFAEVASQHTYTPPPPLSEQIPDILPAVESTILRALAKDPAQRFASVQEFAHAFVQGI
jgi:serine/threonine protein kinase